MPDPMPTPIRNAFGILIHALLCSTLLAATEPADTPTTLIIYVAANGDDRSDGLTSERAVQSLSQAMHLVPQGGTVLLQRGDIWRETLRPIQNNLRIAATGDGPAPIITGADPVTGFATAASPATGNWQAPLEHNPAQIFINGERAQRTASLDAVTALGHWFWDSQTQTVTVHTGDHPPTAVEASVRDSGIDLQGRTGMQIQDLRIEKAGMDGVLARTLDRSTIEHCEIADCYIAGIQLGGEQLRHDITIRKNTITNAGGVGIGFGGRLANWVIEENTIADCATLTQHIVGFGDGRERTLEWTAGIKVWGWAAEGWVGYYTIRNNDVIGCKPVEWAPGAAQTHGHGIWADEVLKPTARPQIYGNTVTDCFANGIYLEKTDDHDVTDNLVIDCGQIRFTAALHAQSNPFGYDVAADRPDDQLPRKVSGNRFLHNTAIGGWWSLAVAASSPGCSISDTEVSHNVLVRRNGAPGWIYLNGGGANDGTHGSGNRYTANTFGPGGDNASWVWNGTLYREYAALEKASHGAITASFPGKPTFQDEANGNFRLCHDSLGGDSETGKIRLGKRFSKSQTTQPISQQ